jgi:queuine tRNA-ribosyltransferase
VKFDLLRRCPATGARRGRLTLPHAVVETPVFMPVGTQGTVKAMSQQELAEIGFRLILGNTYHLHLRPGEELIRRAGGLHRFIGWDGALLTDSGGYQVFSLTHLRRLSEEGVAFKSYLDGSDHLFTPEAVIDIQLALGADIIMAFDECPPYPCERPNVRAAMERTHRWALRSLAARSTDAALFAIVQGGLVPELRRESAAFLTEHPFDGFAIGGLAVGDSRAQREETVAYAAELLPGERPRYLMGVGTPPDLLHAIGCGVDLFDCVLPTRHARTGQLFTAGGPVAIRHAVHARDPRPLDETCPCYTCRHFSRAYLRHLFLARELTVYRLHTLHNLTYYLGLMADARAAIAAGTFDRFRHRILDAYPAAEAEPVSVPADRPAEEDSP